MTEQREFDTMQVRQDWLIKQTFKNWLSLRPNLREQKFESERYERSLTKNFQRMFTWKLVFRKWKRTVSEKSKEKHLKVHKEQMWNKVNKWLVDFDIYSGNQK